MKDIRNIVKKRIDEYLEFDSDIFFSYGDPIIFGGAVRDSIANMEIHDVDILVGSNSANKLHFFLESIGYKFMDKLLGKDISEMYKGIHVISEPRTYIRNNKIIQLIRPRPINYYPPGNSKNENYDETIRIIENLISNVDISSCGVGYNGTNVVEYYPNAIAHASQKVFMINNLGTMKTDRLNNRVYKLIDRGWTQLDNTSENVRDVNINDIIWK